MKNIKFHSRFKLNRKSFSEVKDVIDFSKGISDEVHFFLVEWFNQTNFVKVQTSGSTGSPKEIQLKKEYMKNSAKATGTFFNLRENTSALLCMSANFIAGKMMLVRALELGWQLDVVEPSSNPLESIKKQYDFSAMVPLQLHNSLNELSKVRKLIVGGGVVSKELFQKIQNKRTEIFATYGMTETITHIAIKQLNNFSESEFDSTSYYKTLPEVKLSQDDKNCLVIDAPKVSSEKIITNDIVNLFSENEFEWLGRYDTIINSGGVKLIPEQIEKKISEIIDVHFFVYGLPDKVLGEKLVLVIEGEKDEDLKQKLSILTSLTKFEQPKEIYFIPNFIETPTQKINRKETIHLL